MSATGFFKDGRTLTIEGGAERHVYLDKDGKKYTFTRLNVDTFRETDCQQLKWWLCDCGRGWWGGDEDEEAEARGCFSCRNVVRILDLRLAEAKRQRQSWWRNVVDVLVDAARKRVRQ